MDWYYSAGREQRGPVSEADFARMIAAGEIAPDALAWRDGMGDWAKVGSLGIAGMPVACVECGKTFPADATVELMGHSVCAGCKDRAVEKYRLGMPLGSTAWRDGNQLVIVNQSSLPDVCVRCGEPAAGSRLKRTFYWHHPAFYALILFNLIVFVIVAMCVRQKLVCEIGVCRTCRSKRVNQLLLGWGFFFGGIVVGVAGIANEAAWGFAGLFMLLFGLVWVAIKTPWLKPKKIEKDGYGWFAGASPRFLESLNEWRGK